MLLEVRQEARFFRIVVITRLPALFSIKKFMKHFQNVLRQHSRPQVSQLFGPDSENLTYGESCVYSNLLPVPNAHGKIQ